MAAAVGIDQRSVGGCLREGAGPPASAFARQLQPSGYLVGDRFTIADLTLASLLAPAVAPEQFPYAQPQRGPPAAGAPARRARRAGTPRLDA
jgi:glutathione S-transferase